MGAVKPTYKVVPLTPEERDDILNNYHQTKWDRNSIAMTPLEWQAEVEKKYIDNADISPRQSNPYTLKELKDYLKEKEKEWNPDWEGFSTLNSHMMGAVMHAAMSVNFIGANFYSLFYDSKEHSVNWMEAFKYLYFAHLALGEDANTAAEYAAEYAGEKRGYYDF